jgi:hypothetical protein
MLYIDLRTMSLETDHDNVLNYLREQIEEKRVDNVMQWNNYIWLKERSLTFET